MKPTKKLRSLFIALGCACLLSLAPAYAQTVTGTINGTVTDATNAVIPNAEIIATNTETGATRSAKTNAEGFYNLPFLPLGRYQVTAKTTGFSTTKRENIEVTLNQTLAVNFALQASAASAEITITAEPAPINTTNAEIKQSLGAQQIVDRPVANQGNFLTLAETFTGFQENPTSGQNNPTASSGSSINFNGTGTRGATFQINGVNNDDSSENQNRQGASLATIKEFQAITNNYSAEFGRGYGAVILVQTKSGTNSFRGEAYEYHNDSFLNAKSHFNTAVAKPVNRRNQFGGVLGFPIFKNKLFGFISYDRVSNFGALGYTRDVFLAAERDSSQWFRTTPTNNTPANRAFIESVLNRVPTRLVPNDSRSTRTFVGEAGFNRPLQDYSTRLDWTATERDNVTARYQYTRQILDNTDVIIGEATKQNNKQQNLGATWTHIFSNTTVGEVRYGLGLRTTLVGIKAGDDTPVIRFVGSPVAGSIIGNAGNFPINRFQTDHQFVYNLSSIVANRHFIKAGTDIRRQQLDDKADNFSRGFYNFNQTCGGTNYGTAYAALLNGCIATYQRGYGPFFLENRISESNFYVEDNWKLKQNFTLNLGVRYEYVSAPREAKNRIEYGYGNDTNNWQPRVGFAYSPGWTEGMLAKITGGKENTSVRGGYGIYHGRIFQSVFSQTGAGIRFNLPNAAFLSYLNSNTLGDPTNGFVFTPGAPPTARYSIVKADSNLEMPYTQQWNMTIERKLPFKSAFRATYSGNRGIGLLRFLSDNLPLSPLAGTVTVANHPNNAPAILYTAANRPAGDPRAVDIRGQTLKLAADPICAGTGLVGILPTATCPVAVPIGPNEISLRLTRTNERRPDGQFGTNTVISNNVWSYYHGLQLEWNKNPSQGLFVQASYTLSKAIDTTSEATFVGAGDSNANGPDVRAARGLSRFHTPQRLTFFTSYELPWLKRRKDFLGQAFGGWKTSVVMKMVAGTPFTIANVGGLGDLNFDGFTDSRPVLLDNSLLGRTFNNPNTALDQIPRAAFRVATPADYGCCVLGRNTFFIDGTRNFDLSLFKTFKLPFNEQRHSLVVRADMFNAFNHVQYGFPSLDIGNANFGRITGTANSYQPRNVQFSMRYVF